MDASDFYTGIVAELYKPLKTHSQAWEPYASFIAQSGQPALELGCGDGDPILDLRRNGIDVDGVDSSADMLARCAERAAQERLNVPLHHQRMEELNLPRRYASIFLAGPTFTLLPDDQTAVRALQGIRKHLTDDGSALVPLFIPSPTPQDQIGKIKEAMTEDGTALRVSVISEDRDEDARTQRTVLRYEKHFDGENIVEERPWTLHWQTQEGFRELVEDTGLTVSAINGVQGGAAAPDASEFAFLLRPGH
ncbi:class I SAM-dependent methyltransferase [Arthrobacter sp. H14]|uniref:class I SAM-dependent methyltransferase n=1 Tax=Arthrobacter sp. H14 TaxID=1312959 RepID=UPI00047A3210|nr:class I SAM-dependent methyltransferase [Arthrobacter sp. H14]